MRNKTRHFASMILLLTLVVGCFAALPQTTRAADDSVYTLTEFVNNTRSNNVIYYTGGSSTAATSTLMKLVDQYGNVIYALCVNQKITTNLGVKYEMVDLDHYPGLSPSQKDQILAVLNYVSINYGLDTAKGIALAQTVVWRIIHPDIAYINPQAGVGITRAEIDTVYDHRFDLALQYDVDVTMQGTANRVESGNYAYYGPFSVSYNYALKDIDFVLTFTAGGANAAFTNAGQAIINRVKPGESFYVRVPISASEANISFNAKASKEVNLVTGMKFLVSVGSNSQPLVVYQPLVQPLVNPTGKLYTYSCDGGFSFDIRGSLKVYVDVAKEIETSQEVLQRDVWDIVQRDVWDIVQRDVWDIVQRDVWDIVQRDVWD
ncbi:MAG: hypothetical protein LBI79_09060, partial [Nitrososphaerota archaeon]|nr:hypothetical protein [Nitrososphaerota archaeon]